MRLSSDNIAELIVVCVLSASALIAVFTFALRFGVRPLLEDWARLRAQLSGGLLDRRLSAIEDDIRQLKASSSLQLPADLRPADRPRV